MKSRLNYIKLLALSILVVFAANSCNKFLTIPPLDDFTDDNYWRSESNVETFAWGLYNQFTGYGSYTYADFYWQKEGDNSYEMKFSEDLLNNTFLGFPKGVYIQNSKWNGYYSNIRKTNLMIERVADVEMLEPAKNHWTGVAKFFRAYNYFGLVSSWGGVPMPLKYTSPDSEEEIYLPRSERKVVVDQIVADLKDAISKLDATSPDCEVNKDVASALLARVALFEGTFRKYHKLGDADAMLELAATTAQGLIDDAKYSLNNTFKNKFVSDDLSGNKEMILYKRYEQNVLMHSIQSHTHCSAPAISGLTKYAVDSYACADGLPISQSTLYMGDQGIDNVRANRDDRLLGTIAPDLGYYGKPYAEILVSSTGYILDLFDNPEVPKDASGVTLEGGNYIDAPLFTISEIYLILAEAKAELGTLTQTDLDATINKLRERAKIAPLTLSGSDVMASGVVINDPVRTSPLEVKTKGGVVSPIIWEIRRERRAELMSWMLLRHSDIDRWAKGEYMSSADNKDVMLGAWIGSLPAGIKSVGVNENGYITYPEDSPKDREFNEKYYLDPIPQDNIILYENKGYTLEQNPGW